VAQVDHLLHVLGELRIAAPEVRAPPPSVLDSAPLEPAQQRW
jgi:hypothetical protein